MHCFAADVFGNLKEKEGSLGYNLVDLKAPRVPVSHSIVWGIPPFRWEGRRGGSRGKLPFSGKEKSFSFEDELVKW